MKLGRIGRGGQIGRVDDRVDLVGVAPLLQERRRETLRQRGAAQDLEGMRHELVGVNHRLQDKIKEKEQSEARREELQRQLRHRQRLETVGTLAGGIAHEINNVLVPIILFTSTVLKDESLAGGSRENLERVLAAARRAKDVVKKILMFTRELDEAKLALIDLRVVTTEGLNLFSALAPPSIEIRTEIAEAIPLVKADATLALHLMINLCTNAYQAMEGADGVLTIGLRYSEPADDGSGAQPRVELWVSDICIVYMPKISASPALNSVVCHLPPNFSTTSCGSPENQPCT